MENMQNNNMGGGVKNMCKCPHHKAFPILVILFGLIFLLGALDIVTSGFVVLVWPVLVIIAGVMKLTGKSCKCC